MGFTWSYRELQSKEKREHDRNIVPRGVIFMSQGRNTGPFSSSVHAVKK